MSLMSGKSFAAGELGILVTDDTKLYERAMAFGHYERNNGNYIKESEDLKPYFHIALGGFKGRANQVCSAIARVQLKYYDERCAEIRKAINYFWDLLEGLPGIRPIRVNEAEGSHMGGWYCPHGRFFPEELGGLSVGRFSAAVRAEGFPGCWDGGNFCLHTHPFFKTFDLTHAGVPSRIEYNDRDVRLDDDKCAPSESVYCFLVPWFKHYDKEWIERYANVFKKVAENYEQLLDGDFDNCIWLATKIFTDIFDICPLHIFAVNGDNLIANLQAIIIGRRTLVWLGNDDIIALFSN
jgi:dTDP-4-amino-4,6-dideoxygalactose transaminase